MRISRLLLPLAVVALAAALAVAPSPASAARGTGKPAPLRVLVSNDDGIGAPGIDALVNALRKRSDVRLTIVAPAENQSGSGGKTTAGPVADLPARRAKTKSGVAAWAVAGFPADSIRYALAKVVKPRDVDLVIAGVNQGANLGPFVNLSGTVGAARAAAQRGIPALATSTGTLTVSDFRPAVARTMAWLAANRRHLVKGTVQNLNVPECSAGAVRGTATVASAPAVPAGANVFSTVDCGQTGPAGASDVSAYLAGFAAVAKIPARPVTAAR